MNSVLRSKIAILSIALAMAGGARAQTPGPVPAPGFGTYGSPMVSGKGHINLGGGQPPALSACGTGPIGPFGDDVTFNFQMGIGASNACTITPAQPYALRPTCNLDIETGGNSPAYAVANNGTITITANAPDSARIHVQCFAQPGGL